MTDTHARAGHDTPSESFALRRGGSLTLTPDGIYVDRPDEDTIRVDHGNVIEIQYESVDWFVAILSVVLVGFGLYSTPRDVLLGLAFAAAGAVSLYLTYRKRDKLSFKVSGRAKPLLVYPENAERVYRTLGALVAEE